MSRYADPSAIRDHVAKAGEDRGLFAPECERGLISACLSEPSSCEATFDAVEPAAFGDSLLGKVWGAARARFQAGRNVSPELIDAELSADKDLAERGGVQWLRELRSEGGTSAVAEFGAVVADRATRRAVAHLLSEATTRLAKADDATEVIDQIERDVLQVRLSNAERIPTLTSAYDASARVLAELDAPAAAVKGITTGLPPLDKELGPLQPGELVLFMGRPSMGKSAASECVGLNIARSGWGVIQLNGEMTPDQMARRHLTDLCFDRYSDQGPEYRDIRRREISADGRQMLGEAHEILRDLPLLMAKRPGLKLAQLRSLVRRQTSLWARSGIPLGAVIIDHVGLLKPDSRRTDRYEAQTEISNGLKELADELSCVIIGLNQMNRENEKRDDKRPQLSDLRDSGSWEQDADFVIGFYRESYYASRQPEPKRLEDQGEWMRAKHSRTVEANILKAREGANASIELWGDMGRNAIRGGPPEDPWGRL